GSPGSKILSGSGAPQTSTGTAGDFYFDTEAADIYGPKTASGWGAGISLKSNSNQYGAQVLLIKGHQFEVREDEYGGLDIESKIILGNKYDDYYENGLVIVQLRGSDNNSRWGDYEVDLITFDDPGKNLYATVREITKDHILIKAWSDGISEETIKNAKFDIKIV